MMTAAGVGSLIRCSGCSSIQQQRIVGSVVDIASGSLRETKSRRKQAYYLKRNAFPERPKLALSSGRHIVFSGSMNALVCSARVDTTSEIVTHDTVDWAGPKVKLRLRVDHQIQFGEHVALLGSSEAAGSWNNRVMMGWTEDGWVVDLEADPGETIEYKYIIVTRDGDVVWEHGENRVLVVPDDISKSYKVVSHWSITSEAIDFEVIDESQSSEGGATEAEAEQELMSERGDFEVVDGIPTPEIGALEVEKGAKNERVDYKVIEETQALAVVMEPELEEPDVTANGSAILEKRMLPYNENFSKSVVEGDLTSTTWWGPVSIILSILLIVYEFLSLPRN